MTNLKLSISLVNTNNRDLLRECLKSLYEQDHGVTFEVVLVDNISTDGSVEMVQSEFPQVKVMVNTKRMGFAANHNQAIQECKADYILVFNEDTIVKPGALKAMTDYLDTHSDTGAVGCRLENPDGTLQRSCYKFPTPWRKVAENLLLTAAFPNNPIVGDYRGWNHDEVREVDMVIGAVLMVRRAVIEKTGLLDEGFFIYSEETDWCLRMHKDGFKVAFVPNGTIVHYGGQSSVAMKDRQFCESVRNEVRYIRKHFGLSGEMLYRASMLFGSVLRIGAFSVIRFVPGKREAADRVIGLWWRMLKWHLGFGPREGIREMAQRFVPPTPTSQATN